MSTTTVTTTIHPDPDPLSPTHWTAPQELTLLRTLTATKPTGLHAHFRMISILTTLTTSTTIPHPLQAHPHASTSAGVWRKLESLYDLKALDEREDAIFAETDADDGEGEGEGEGEGDDGGDEYWREFELDDNAFGGLMWERRLAGTGDDEAWSDDGSGGDDDDEEKGKADEDDGDDVRMKERESTVGDSEDPRSSPIGSTRGTRSSGRRAAAAAAPASAVGKRLAEVKQEDGAASSTRGSRRTSKAASPSVKPEEEEDTEMHDAEDDEDGSGDDDDDSEPEETEDDSRKSTRSTRARSVRRGGRLRRGRRGK